MRFVVGHHPTPRERPRFLCFRLGLFQPRLLPPSFFLLAFSACVLLATLGGGCDSLTTCTNLPGSFTCSLCPPGYRGDATRGCVDIDECVLPNACDALTHCTNLPG